MLVKIKPIGDEYIERFLAVKEWPEVIFTREVVSLLSEFKFVDKVYKSSVRVKIDAKEPTHTHLPSQYFLNRSMYPRSTSNSICFNVCLST